MVKFVFKELHNHFENVAALLLGVMSERIRGCTGTVVCVRVCSPALVPEQKAVLELQQLAAHMNA